MYRLQVHPRLVGASVGGKQPMCLSLSLTLPPFLSFSLKSNEKISSDEDFLKNKNKGRVGCLLGQLGGYVIQPPHLVQGKQLGVSTKGLTRYPCLSYNWCMNLRLKTFRFLPCSSQVQNTHGTG